MKWLLPRGKTDRCNQRKASKFYTDTDILPPLHTVRERGIFGQSQRLVRGSPRGGSGGEPTPRDAGEVFKVFRKKAMKNYNLQAKFFNFLIILINLRFLKLSRIFREKLVKIEKIQKYEFIGGSASEASEFIKNVVQKSMIGNLAFLKILINCEIKFDFQKLI